MIRKAIWFHPYVVCMATECGTGTRRGRCFCKGILKMLDVIFGNFAAHSSGNMVLQFIHIRAFCNMDCAMSFYTAWIKKTSNQCVCHNY